MNKLLLIIVVLLLAAVVYYWPQQQTVVNAAIKLPDTILETTEPVRSATITYAKMQGFSKTLKTFAARKNYSTSIAFFIDMSLSSGQKRFFIYDLQADSVMNAGLVSHGSCHEQFLKAGRYSNTPNSGCTSIGKYKVGYAYQGNFGKAYKLFGLDSTNNKAFERYVVLHGYSCVPDVETYPQPICNSLGCPMVSYAFLNSLEYIIDNARQPILLWIYE